MYQDNNQIGTLIKRFKALLEFDKPEIKAKTESRYPLNQYNPVFSSKTKGYTPVDWRDALEMINNEIHKKEIVDPVQIPTTIQLNAEIKTLTNSEPDEDLTTY